MSSRIKTLWVADLTSDRRRATRGGLRKDSNDVDFAFGGRVYGAATREMLKWVLENVPDAEIGADLQVTFRRETDAAAFKVRFG